MQIKNKLEILNAKSVEKNLKASSKYIKKTSSIHLKNYLKYHIEFLKFSEKQFFFLLAF